MSDDVYGFAVIEPVDGAIQSHYLGADVAEALGLAEQINRDRTDQRVLVAALVPVTVEVTDQ